MFRSDLDHTPARSHRRPPLNTLLIASAVLGCILAVAAFAAFGVPVASVAVFACVVALTGFGVAQSYPHDSFGLCNLVTLTRATMVVFLGTAVFFPETSAWLIVAVATVALMLDGVDGWLARRAGLESAFGARFDMETDAALAAVMSLWLLASGTTGPEVLVLGFMRYAFVLASVLWPALRQELPDSFRRKVVCVLQIATLVVLVVPLTPAPLIFPIGAIGATVLAWSFLTDILWLARQAG